MTHRCEDIHYTHGANSQQAPMVCSCGWEGLLAEWEAHRAEQRAGRSLRNIVDEPFRRKVPWSLKP